MIRWGLLALVASCVSSNSIECDFGLCPEGTACDATHHLCVDPDQLAGCDGLAPGADCTAVAGGHCIDNVCLPTVCSDGVVEPGEMCDDGNTYDKDGCAADCLTDFTCGNGVTDPGHGEQCDDHNLFSHDGCSSTCTVERAHWVEHTLTPGGRSSAASAYDFKRDRFVVFGGYIDGLGNERGDTLEWNGAEWLRAVTPAAPTPRHSAAMAYDADHGVSVLFGGFDGTFDLSDTWLWNGVVWEQLPGVGPSERYGATMAFDPRRHVVVLFGGFNDANYEQGDTWEWNGSVWTQIDTPVAPGARVHAAMVYDPKRGAIVLTGGSNSQANPDAYYADVWSYDGTWHDITPAGTPKLNGAMISYDTTTSRILLAGGYNVTTPSAAVYAWDGTGSWATLTASAPFGALVYGMMASVRTGNTTVVFGGRLGSASSPATWVGGGATWVQPTDLPSNRQYGVVNDFVNRRVLTYGGLPIAGGTQGNTWELSPTGFKLRAGPPPPKRGELQMAWDYAHHGAVMYGGRDSQTLGDTWIWDGNGWSQRTPAMSPGPRRFAAMAYDGAGVTLIGGQDDLGPIADAWTWDGTAWTKIAAPIEAASRVNGVAGYDEIRKQLVLFGGSGPSASLDDTWVYDGIAKQWQGPMPGFRPSKRTRATLTWCPARQALILVGGISYITDAYEWDGTSWHYISALDAPLQHNEHGAFATLDGAGIEIAGGFTSDPSDPMNYFQTAERLELRWDGTSGSERCEAIDADGDGKIACDDPDCWPLCAPLCPPGTTCDPNAPHCGDGVCDSSRENCQTCHADCTCTPACGDGVCDSGETCPGDCP